MNAPRILLAEGDAGVRGAWANALDESGAALRALHAADAREASEAVLLGHPELVIVSLDLPGHAQGGFRVVLDALSIGVPAVLVSGPITEALRHRLAELDVAWVLRDGSPAALVAAAVCALPALAADVAGPTWAPRASSPAGAPRASLDHVRDSGSSVASFALGGEAALLATSATMAAPGPQTARSPETGHVRSGVALVDRA